MKVREIMTEPPVTCTPETSLAVAARLMRETDYGTLPVVEADGAVAGIITDRDICLALAGTHRSALNVAVHEIMTRKVVTALVEEDVHRALATMKQARVRRLPVMDECGCLKGMLSIEDIVMRALQGRGVNAGELVESLQTMYVRLPVRAESSDANDGYTPG